MFCKKCKTAMRIRTRSDEGDKIRTEYFCPNKRCTEYEKTVTEERKKENE